MPDYKESTAEAKKWQRCYRIFIQNPFSQQKSIQFFEETAVTVDGTTINNHVSDIYEVITDLSKTIELRDPTTGLPLGNSVTYQDVYVILHSAYLQAAEARDASLVIPPTIEPGTE
jgi:hypothetical protein